MEDKKALWNRGRQRLLRRDFLKRSVGAGLILSGMYLLGCAAPAQPTPTVKPAATAAATAPAAATAAPAAGKVLPVEGASKPAGEPKKAVMGTTTGTLGVLTAVIKKQKIDLKNGVDLDIKIFEPSDAERAVALKRVEVGNYAPVSAATAANEGLPIVLFAPLLWNVNYFMVAKDAPYTKVSDLKGKKVATSPKISGAYTSAQVYFKELGLDFEKDFQVITGVPMVQSALLQKKEVEAALFSDPWALQLIASGDYKQLAAANELWKEITGQPMFFVGLGAHRDWYNENRDTAKRLLNTFLEAAKYVQDHPESVEDVKDTVGLKTPQEVEMAKQRMPALFPTKWDNDVIKNAQHIIDRAIELKILPKAPPEPVFALP